MTASDSPEPVERRADRRQASLRRLERKVNQLVSQVLVLTDRVDTINLNGSTDALKRLADNSDKLLKLAEVAPAVVQAVERDHEVAVFWHVLRRWLNPLRPVGAFIWLLLTTVVTATIWNLLTLGGVHAP